MNDKPDTARNTAPASARDSGKLMFSLLHAAKTLESRLEEGLARAELSLAKHGVLSILVEAGEPLPLSELAARQACVRSNMTQLVDRLEADGLVQRVPDPSDRRSVRAALTPLGRERQAAGTVELERVKAEFTATVSGPDRAALQRLLSSIR